MEKCAKQIVQTLKEFSAYVTLIPSLCYCLLIQWANGNIIESCSLDRIDSDRDSARALIHVRIGTNQRERTRCP